METYFIVGKYKYPVTLTPTGRDRIKVEFRYNPDLIAEVKSMQGAKWHGYDQDSPGKYWSVLNSARNHFTLHYLMGNNPYQRYDAPLPEWKSDRPLFPHQAEAASFLVTRRQCILAMSMRTGKTLATIEAIEHLQRIGFISDDPYVTRTEIVWTGPRSALIGVSDEFRLWKSKFTPSFYSYESMKAAKFGDTSSLSNPKLPKVVVFDEAQKLKTISSKRHIQAAALVEKMRQTYFNEAGIFLLTGTPAPKSPHDWWSLAEIACVTDDTWVLTNKGPRQVNRLIGHKENEIYIDSQCYESKNGFFKTGRKEVFEVATIEGYKIKCTADQKFYCNFDGAKFWKELREIGVGQEICLNNHSNVNWGGHGTYEDGYLIGWIVGDGCVSERKYGNYIRLYFYGEDKRILDHIKSCFPSEPSINYNSNNGCYCINGGHLIELVSHYGLDKTKEINNLIEGASKEFLTGFLQAFFDADGNVSERHKSVRLSQSNLLRLEAVQRILLYFGIVSKIYKNNDDGLDEINGIKCNAKANYHLHVTKDNLDKYREQINFKLPRKAEKIKFLVENRERVSQREKFIARIKSITSLGEQDTFDTTVPGPDAFSGNGFKLHNCPGFLKEGDYRKFQNRVSLIQKVDNEAGSAYPKLVTHWDNENKCQLCGKFENDVAHDSAGAMFGASSYHPFKKSINEVVKLYERLKGLVYIKFLKDVLTYLPEKRMKIINVEPSPQIKRTASLIKKSATRAIEALTLLRELSDGFMYQEKATSQVVCATCNGTGLLRQPYWAGEESVPGHFRLQPEYEKLWLFKEDTCPTCKGSKLADKMERTTVEVGSPKDQVIKDILEEYDDYGRVVIYCGFTGSIDRVCKLVKLSGWEPLRVDGRGWHGLGINNPALLYKAFRQDKDVFPKVAFVSQPESGGIGIDLSAAPVCVYYSNSFKGEARMQSIERICGPNMDLNKGCEIVDIIHLEEDQLVLDNLNKKRDLQLLSLGELQAYQFEEKGIKYI